MKKIIIFALTLIACIAQAGNTNTSDRWHTRTTTSLEGVFEMHIFCSCVKRCSCHEVVKDENNQNTLGKELCRVIEDDAMIEFDHRCRLMKSGQKVKVTWEWSLGALTMICTSLQIFR